MSTILARVVKHLQLALILFLFLNVDTVEAQPMLYFRNLGVSDGLPGTMISSFGQDGQGFIWIGTQDGLARYDGLSTTEFLHNPADSTTIGGNFIAWDIQEDNRNRVWLTLHGNGFTRYSPETRSFSNYTYANGKLPAEWCNHTQEFIFGDGGKTYVFCNEGMIVLDSTDHVVSTKFLPDDTELADLGHIRLAEPYKGQFWIATLFGIARYVPQTDTWHYVRRDLNGTDLYRDSWGIHGPELLDGVIWFSTYFKPADSDHRFLYSYNIEENILDSVPIAPDHAKKNAFSDQVKSIVKDSEGKLWLGTDGLGLLNYDPKDGVWKRHNGTDDWRGALLEGSINRLFIDRDENLWIGLKTGVSIMSPHRQHFKNYAVVDDGSKNGLKLTGVRSLAVGPEDDIWLGKLGEGMIHLDADKSYKQQLKTLRQYGSDYDDYMDVRWADSSIVVANVWYGGIHLYNRKTGAVINTREFISKDKPELRNALRTRNGDLFGYGWSQFGKLSLDRKEFSGLTTPLNNDGNPDIVWTAVEDDQGKIWLGMGQRGMLCVDPDSMKIIRSWERDTSFHPKTEVWQMLYHSGKIYFSYANVGMGIYDVETAGVTSYTKSDGLCSDELSGFVLDSDGQIWIYSASGISWFDEANGRFKTFDQTDGMLSEKIDDAALLSNGDILLVSAGGLIEFNPDDLKLASPIYTPIIKGIRVYDKDLNSSEWQSSKSVITVPYDGNYLRVEFSALEFVDPKKVSFAYRLAGAEDDWNYSDHNPTALYTNLSGGDYKLCSKCQNADGIWGEERCISVFVTIPFYKEPWFLVLFFVMIGLLVFSIYRWQLRKRIAILEVRNRLSRDLHDDIGSALSSINIYSSVALQQLDQNKTETRKLLDRIGTSARGMMQSMDDIIWAIDPSNDSVEKLLSRMRQFAAPILEAQEIDFKFDVENLVADLSLDMVQRRNLFLVFKEAINNSAKYSNGSKVLVRVGLVNKDLRICIKDDGVGFDTAEESDRHGLRNMKQRMLEMSGDFTISSSLNVGTEVCFTVPVT